MPIIDDPNRPAAIRCADFPAEFHDAGTFRASRIDVPGGKTDPGAPLASLAWLEIRRYPADRLPPAGRGRR